MPLPCAAHARGVKKRNTHADPRAFCGSAEIINPNTRGKPFQERGGCPIGVRFRQPLPGPRRAALSPAARSAPLRTGRPLSSRPQVSGHVSWWKDPSLVLVGPARSVLWPSPVALRFPPVCSRNTSSQHEPNARSCHACHESLLPSRGHSGPGT